MPPLLPPSHRRLRRSSGAGIRAALAIGVATLALQGIRYARLERLSRIGTLVSVVLNLSLGLLIVGLKALLAH